MAHEAWPFAGKQPAKVKIGPRTPGPGERRGGRHAYECALQLTDIKRSARHHGAEFSQVDF